MNSRGNDHENSEELLSSTQFNVALTLVQKGAQVEIEHLKKQAAEREQQLLEENRRLKAELVLLRSKMVSGSTTTEKREEDHPISPERSSPTNFRSLKSAKQHSNPPQPDVFLAKLQRKRNEHQDDLIMEAKSMPNLQSTRPNWVRDEFRDRCRICEVPFSFFTRKHHCRACGDIFCDDCCNQRIPLPELDYYVPVRCCQNCWAAADSKIARNSLFFACSALVPSSGSDSENEGIGRKTE